MSIPAKRAGKAKTKKEARHVLNKYATPKAIAGVKKKLELPPTKCRPNPLPLLLIGNICDMKDDAGAWYEAPIIPMIMKNGIICQNVLVQLTPIPDSDMPIRPNMIIRRLLNRSAITDMGIFPKPYAILKQDAKRPD